MSHLIARPPLDPDAYDKLQPDRSEGSEIYLYVGDGDADDGPATTTASSSAGNDYRYKLHVVDRPIVPTTKLTYATAIFLIPAGRHVEYLFRTRHGLAKIATSAGTARLVAVSMGSSSQHVFTSQAAVQAELTFVAQVLARRGEFLPPSHRTMLGSTRVLEIPFLALDGMGARNVLTRGNSELSGDYWVEQVAVDDGEQVRRLYFESNPMVMQTEVVWDVSAHQVVPHRATFGYHQAMAAGVFSLGGSRGELATVTLAAPRGLVIGLGGGALTNLLANLVPTCALTAVELDPAVVDVARASFGLREACLEVRIGDGLSLAVHDGDAAVASPLSFATGSFSFLILDVDSKDSTVGMSCPPQAFIARDYLQGLAALLDPTRGVLAINVSARDPALLAVVGQNVADVFGSVFLYREPEETSEDVNVVLFALRPPGVVLPAVAVLAARLQAACAPVACDAEVQADLVERLDDLVPWSLSAAVVVAPESASSLPKQAAPTTTGAKNKSKKKGKKKGRRK